MHTQSKCSLQSLSVSTISTDDLIQIEPNSIQEYLFSPHCITTVQEELYALFANNTWSIVSLPPRRIPISCKWLFRIKRNAYGDIAR